MQREPMAGTISGSPLQTLETPRAILIGAADRGQRREAAGVVGPPPDVGSALSGDSTLGECGRSPVLFYSQGGYWHCGPASNSAVKGFGSGGRHRVSHECRSCGRRGHCGACWMSWRLHGRCHKCVRSVSRTVIPAMFAAVPIKMCLGKFGKCLAFRHAS